MGLITAFDSGTYTGWAQCLDGKIIGCGLILVQQNRPMRDLPPTLTGGVVFIEKPVHRRQGKTVDPNNLITLGIKVGRLQETYLVFGNDVKLIVPTDWKGSVPKEIQNARDENALNVSEALTVGRAMHEVADSYRNNVWDAIGIALWASRREGSR